MTARLHPSLEMAFRNDLNTLQHIKSRIDATPGVLADGAVRRVHHKVDAALDSVQAFRYETHFVQVGPDGTPHDVTMTTSDYSGPAKMTSNAIESLQRIMGYRAHVEP